MPLPASGIITAQMIRQQYGGPNPFRIRDYFRGGAYVPNTAPNSSVPTSGTISLRNFLGQGGSVAAPLAASNSGAYKSDFLAEPAPASKTVSASGTVFASGGTGSYTCTWAHLSGDAGIATPGANNFNPSFSVTVPKNSTRAAVKRCTVNDGVTAVITDMSVTLEYYTSA